MIVTLLVSTEHWAQEFSTKQGTFYNEQLSAANAASIKEKSPLNEKITKIN